MIILLYQSHFAVNKQFTRKLLNINTRVGERKRVSALCDFLHIS